MGEPIQRRFHRSLYPVAAVRRAADRFAPAVGSVDVSVRDSDTVVTLDGVPERIASRIGDELANHVLFEALQERRAGSAA